LRRISISSLKNVLWNSPVIKSLPSPWLFLTVYYWFQFIIHYWSVQISYAFMIQICRLYK
jgi:hypothetical protein